MSPKVAIVTGALRRFGSSLVKGFREIGYNVVANSRFIEASSHGYGPEALAVAGDIALPGTAEAVDCGPVVNPDSVRAQIQGGIVFGLTAALYGEITMQNGRVQQSNFHDYRMMRIDETPLIEVHIISNLSAPPGGVGEAGTVAAAPALANAIFAATGKRLRRIPFATGQLAEA